MKSEGFNPLSLKSELASMRARQVVESGAWSDMKGQGSFDNIDELFALGEASVKLGDAGRAEAALEHLTTAAKSVPDADAREIAEVMGAQLDGLMRLAKGDRAGGLAALARATVLEMKRPKPIARPIQSRPRRALPERCWGREPRGRDDRVPEGAGAHATRGASCSGGPPAKKAGRASKR